jgi:hypothetical protein
MLVSVAALLFVLLAASQKLWPSVIGLLLLGATIMLT